MRGFANVSFNKRMWKIVAVVARRVGVDGPLEVRGALVGRPSPASMPSLHYISGAPSSCAPRRWGWRPRVVRSSIVVVAPRLTRRGAASARGLKVGARAAVGTPPQLRKEKMIRESMVDLEPRREPRLALRSGSTMVFCVEEP